MQNILDQIEQRSSLLVAMQSKLDLDDAIEKLAKWIQFSGHELSEDDLVELILIGAIVYRHTLDPHA